MQATATPEGVSHRLLAERDDADLDEFTVSDDVSRAALLWNFAGGRSELAYLERLAAVAAFHQQGRSLELRDEKGQPLLRFTAQERGEPSLDEIEVPQLPQ